MSTVRLTRLLGYVPTCQRLDSASDGSDMSTVRYPDGSDMSAVRLRGLVPKNETVPTK